MSRHNRAVKDHDKWIKQFPELSTRPLLVQYMLNNGILRARVFQCFQTLESVALIPSHSVAGYCLGIVWMDMRRHLYRYWHDKLRNQTGNDELFNQMYGCIRNVKRNMMIKAGCSPRTKDIAKNPMDIERVYI